MLKLLIKLWLIQKRRNFKWRSFFLALYVYAMLGLVVLMTVIESGINLGGEMDRVEWTLVVPVMAAISCRLTFSENFSSSTTRH